MENHIYYIFVELVLGIIITSLYISLVIGGIMAIIDLYKSARRTVAKLRRCIKKRKKLRHYNRR